jgi:hypothetical protein
MKDIKSLLEAILFNDEINEIMNPDHYNKEFSSSSINDRKGPAIDGNNNYTASYDNTELPIASSQVMPDHITTSKLDFDDLASSNYKGPNNKIELVRAINSMISDLDLSHKQISLLWRKNLNLLKKFKG